MAQSTKSGDETSEKTIREQNRQRALDYLRENTNELSEKDALFIADDEKFTMEESLVREKEVTSKDSVTMANAARDSARRRLQKYMRGQSSGMPSVETLCVMLEVEHGASNVIAIDVSKKAVFTDWLVVASGLSARHVIGIAEGIRGDLRAAQSSFDAGTGMPNNVRMSGQESGHWVVVDGGNVVIHVMTEESREIYALEQLWSDGGNIGDLVEEGEGLDEQTK